MFRYKFLDLNLIVYALTSLYCGDNSKGIMRDKGRVTGDIIRRMPEHT